MVCRMVESRGILSDLGEGYSLHPRRGPGLSETEGLSESFAVLERYVRPIFLSSPSLLEVDEQALGHKADVSFIHSALEESVELLARCIPQSYTEEIGMFFFTHRLKGEIERREKRWRRVCIKFQVSFPQGKC